MGVHVSGYNTFVKLVLISLLVSAAWAQPLRVYSEFAQIDEKGRVTTSAEPREILSPAIVRNGFTSFQIVVDVAPGTSYQLYVVQNPENAVRVTLYRENGDKLERVDQPVSGTDTQIFWMDLWTNRDAPVQRIKVEPQLYVNNDWVIYPMEARVTSATVPSAGDTPDTDIRSFLCRLTPRPNTHVAEGPRSRNAQQDVRLAAIAPKEDLQKLFGECDAPVPSNPEEYLRVRDYLFRLR